MRATILPCWAIILTKAGVSINYKLHKKVKGVFFYVLTWSFSYIEGGGARKKKFPLIKRGGGHNAFYPVLGGGGRKQFWTRDFPIL